MVAAVRTWFQIRTVPPSAGFVGMDVQDGDQARDFEHFTRQAAQAEKANLIGVAAQPGRHSQKSAQTGTCDVSHVGHVDKQSLRARFDELRKGPFEGDGIRRVNPPPRTNDAKAFFPGNLEIHELCLHLD